MLQLVLESIGEWCWEIVFWNSFWLTFPNFRPGNKTLLEWKIALPRSSTGIVATHIAIIFNNKQHQKQIPSELQCILFKTSLVYCLPNTIHTHRCSSSINLRHEIRTIYLTWLKYSTYHTFKIFWNGYEALIIVSGSNATNNLHSAT